LLTDSNAGIKATVEKASEVAREMGAYLLNQFENLDNPKAHHVTGKEIIRQLGNVDLFVAGVGTGGTLVGIGKYLKNINLKTKLVAIEPDSVPAFFNLFYEKELPISLGIPHKIEGIGESFVPKILLENLDLVDDVVLVKDEYAFRTMRQLSKDFGYCVGISSGANMYVAWNLAKENASKVVTVLPDSGQRYFE
jgi:cysteine synthase A